MCGWVCLVLNFVVLNNRTCCRNTVARGGDHSRQLHYIGWQVALLDGRAASLHVPDYQCCIPLLDVCPDMGSCPPSWQHHVLCCFTLT